ncbi:RHS repeat-associated core domain-containing protein [Marinomonas sp. C1424]|uniref:RHS repeat-associated core domain-containing protein n=2 Tax=Marinomonas transparens TaxID=2795388 RepID=A0A934JTH3_9GAMM|nr:RHS repeat-associated core domain-containing protein [Marinomonas transparens]
MAGTTTWLTTGDQSTNKLISVHDGLIKRAIFEYETINAFSGTELVPLSSESKPQLLVSKLSQSDGIGGENSLSYHYQGKRSHLQGLGDLGFESITKTNNTTGVVTTTRYSQDWQNRNTHRPLETTQTYNGVELSHTLNSYSTLQKDGVFFTYADTSTTVKRDLTNAVTSVESTDRSYSLHSGFDYVKDSSTTCVAETDPGLSNGPVSCAALSGKIQQSTTQNTYYYAGYVANRPPMLQRQTVTSEVYNNILPFDQANQQTRTQTFDYHTNTGLLKTSISEPDGALRLVTEYAYNGRGQQTSVTVNGGDIATNSTTSSYSDLAPYNLLSTSNVLDHTQSYQYSDARFPWLPTKAIAINGVETTLTYDSMGSKASQTSLNQTTAWTYAWCDACDGVARAKYKVTQTQTNQADSIAYYDARHRVVATHGSGLREDYVTALYQTVQYDALGREIKTSLPYYEGDSPLYSSKEYDVLNRIVKETQANGNVRIQRFNGRDTTVELQTADGTLQKREVKNALGQTMETVDNDGNAMQFQYNAFGQLTRTTDPEQNQILIGYDVLGRKIQMDDPDQGVWTYQYYVNGNLKSQTDANGNVTTYAYDALGRKISQTAPEGTSTWRYDNCANGIGQLCEKSGHGLTESYVYTTAGQLAQSTTTIEGLDYTYRHSYDNTGRLISTQYPTGYTTQTDYHSLLGFASKVRHDDTVIWEAKGFNARGQLENMAMNNGQIQSVKYYEDGEDQVRQINVINNNKTVALINYDWSKTGNLRMQTDYTNGVVFGYTYDSLSRLKSTTTTVVGADYGTVSLDYDALGNILQKTDVGDYSYNNVSQHDQCSVPAGPHAVSSIDGRGDYCYDHNGNMLSGDDRQITYSSFNKPTRIQQHGETSYFSYGPDQQRYKQTTSGTLDKTVYYIGGYEKEIRDGQTYHRIQIGDSAIVEKVDDNAARLNYTVRDHLGSLIATISDAGTVKRLFYDPWGKRLELPIIEAQPLALLDLANFLTPRGFTGHEHLDNVGLIHMNGRVYDPEIARFISADPIIQAPMYLQDYNRYTYAWNNPLAITDPSGFIDDYSNSQPDSSWNGGSGSSSSSSSGGSGDGGSSNVSSYGYPSGVKWDPGSANNGGTFASDDRDSGSGSGSNTTVTNSSDDAAARAEQARKDALAAQLKEAARIAELNRLAEEARIYAARLEAAAQAARQAMYRPSNTPLQCLSTCSAEQFGFQTIVGGGLTVAGSPILSKPFQMGNASKGTSPASKFLSEKFPHRLGRQIPTPRIGHLRSATPVVGRALGRFVPVVGQGLLLYDGVSIGACTVSCINDIR